MTLNSTQAAEIVAETEFSKRGPLGIDLSVKSISKVKSGNYSNGITVEKTIIEDETYEELQWPEDGDYLLLEAGFYSVTFNEGMLKPVPQNIHGFIHQRSSLNRIGGLIKTGVFECGFFVPNIGAHMFLANNIFIEKNSRIAQIVFEENYESDIDYESQWQGLKDKK